MCFLNLCAMFLAVHSSLATAFQKCLLLPSSLHTYGQYIWIVLSREAVILGSIFFPSSGLVENFGVVKFILGL